MMTRSAPPSSACCRRKSWCRLRPRRNASATMTLTRRSFGAGIWSTHATSCSRSRRRRLSLKSVAVPNARCRSFWRSRINLPPQPASCPTAHRVSRVATLARSLAAIPCRISNKRSSDWAQTEFCASWTRRVTVFTSWPSTAAFQARGYRSKRCENGFPSGSKPASKRAPCGNTFRSLPVRRRSWEWSWRARTHRSCNDHAGDAGGRLDIRQPRPAFLAKAIASIRIGRMLGDLIANLDRPDVARAVLATLDPKVAARIERRAAAAAMIAPDFIAGAVREFVERADDELWLQLLTIMRKAENPGLGAIQAILGWVVADEQLGS